MSLKLLTSVFLLKLFLGLSHVHSQEVMRKIAFDSTNCVVDLYFDKVLVDNYTLIGPLPKLVEYLRNRPEADGIGNFFFDESICKDGHDLLSCKIDTYSDTVKWSSSNRMEIIFKNPEDFINVLHKKTEIDKCSYKFNFCRNTKYSMSASADIDCGELSYSVSTSGSLSMKLGNLKVQLDTQ